MKTNLKIFQQIDFLSALKQFFNDLNVPINYVADEPTTAKEVLKETYKDKEAFQLIGDVYFVGMVDDAAFEGNQSINLEQIKSDYDAILIFGLTINERPNKQLPTRSQLAEIARAFNREFYYTPVVVIFKYGSYLAFANSERVKYKQMWREGEKAGKVSLLRDINLDKTHSGHERILAELVVPTSGIQKVDSFDRLYSYWQQVFSASVLNKKFYDELSSWYFWATKQVVFPGEPTSEVAHAGNKNIDELLQEHRATNVIRLLTRLLFVWFLKEKKLIPDELFDIGVLQSKILNEISPYHETGMFKERNKESVFYKAILQNLFFATLNCPIEGDRLDKRMRGFRGEGYGTHRGIDYLLRYRQYFKNPDEFLKSLNQVVPFLNGGLFECLDDKYNNIYVDGFSDQMSKGEQLIVPDYIFFGVEEETDLSDIVGISDKKYKQAAVKGLINILKSYKFTITENTPIEEDVALDPELLGKVFENLLASYNPETKTTARKQTGSFYTPREIVNYMVDESLIAYLKNAVSDWGGIESVDDELHLLTSFDSKVPFADKPELQIKIITALSNCTILDPACGSGAFPMGILQKMVQILQKLDPDNMIWKEVQLAKAEQDSKVAFEIEDKKAREERLLEINDAFDQSINDPDYARKLFLIENCIYGVDIQPIATQISKLRFFISLVVEQKVNPSSYNFGIRPLPNLETKFVTANTLIGIEKPKLGDQLNLYSTDGLKTLEAKLKKVRSRLFSAKSKETKLKYREEDKLLRNDIAKELEQSGWRSDTARKLAGWDPYDQNSSSTFFDPEWMFDIKDGFDVVIGNPPYKILTRNNTDENELEIYLIKYESIQKSSSKNLYTLFIEKGVHLTKENGNLSYIVPEGLYTTRSYAGCVDLMERYGSTTQIITFSDFVFENAITGNLIFLYRKTNRLSVKHLNFDRNYVLGEKYEAKNSEIHDIQNGTFPLKDIAITFKGMVVKDRELVLSSEPDKDVFLLGKNISKWRINSCQYTDYRKLTIIGGTKKLSKHSISPRILIRRTGDSLCCAYLDNPALTESTLYSTWSIDNRFSNIFLFGILNSKLLDHYNKINNITNRQGFPQILMTDLELLPIKLPTHKYSIIIEFLTLIMLSRLSIVVELVLNASVFDLYFTEHMRERGIDVIGFVENDINYVMEDKLIENLSEIEIEQVINALQVRWNHPDNEVSKRIKLFAERSPEILKPILES